MKRTLVHFISTLFPNLVVSFAYRKLTSPQVKKLRSNELLVLDTAQKENFVFKGFNIQLYTWNGGDRKILLIHGWEGQAGNFADFIVKLREQNYTIYAFDAPSHGHSSKGKTSLFEFTELVGILIRKFQVSRLISHSFGGVATTYALFSQQDLKIDTYILLTTPDKFIERIDDIVTEIGISQKVKKRLILRLEQELNLRVSQLNVSDFVRSIDVKRPLIFHGVNDKVLPIERSKNVYRNWDNCQFIEVENSGHFRILRTDHVIQQAIDFLSHS